ncbi:MAG: MotA/TolQ/ExbB proton channel family protein [Veillonella sp.]|nr:MotA/TolQ/ExbB proton channel family protein [Veillonella sp.]
MATASGLCVAIMAFIVYTFFSHRLDSIINQIEGMCVSIVSAKREGWK